MIEFYPFNDQVLIKLDVMRKSVFALDASKPTILPSGTVIRAGRGTFLQGVGFQESQVKPGDHVALSLDGPWASLPLVPKESGDVYISVSESMILGRIEGASEDSSWFSSVEEAQSRLSSVVGRRGS